MSEYVPEQRIRFEPEEEDRSYKKDFHSPNPVLNMGVEIRHEWVEDFWKLAGMLKLSHKETINWVVNQWFTDHQVKPATSGVGKAFEAMLNMAEKFNEKHANNG